MSNMDGEELTRLATEWPSLAVARRRAIVSRLVEIAEADLETDFSSVFTMCFQDDDPQVRASAIDGLWENEDCLLIRPLVRFLERDEATLVRESAATSLSRFALLAELGKLQPCFVDLVWNALWRSVHNEQEDLDVRRRAVESLAYFGRPEVRQVIADAYEHDEPRMRASAVFAMGRSGDETWADTVQQELDSRDPEMRYEAIRSCGALQIAEAIPTLSRLVADPDPEVKQITAWALGQIGGPEARRVLEICYEEGDEALQDAADEALAEMDFMQGTLDLALYDLDPDKEDWEDEEEPD